MKRIKGIWHVKIGRAWINTGSKNIHEALFFFTMKKGIYHE